MDVSRLRNLAEAVPLDYTHTRVIPLLQTLQTAFTQSVQSPNQETAQTYENARNAFFEAARSSNTRELSASKLAILEQLHASDLVGDGLVTRTGQILTSGVSPATIVAGLEELRKRMQGLETSFNALSTTLAQLDIKSEEPSPGEAEAEITFPGKIFDDSLAGLARESKKLNDALLVLVEAATGSRPPITIHTISTGSLEIVVSVNFESARVLLQVTAAILSIIASMLSLKRIRLDLEQRRAPKSIQDELNTWYGDTIAEKIGQIRNDVLSTIKEEHRRTELSGPTNAALRYLAERIDSGMRINIDAKGAATSSAEQSQLRNELSELQRQVIALSNDIKQLSPSSEPALALLPSSDEAGKDEPPAN